MVQIYGKPGCVQCDYTKKRLEAKEVPYQYHDITVDEQAMMIVRQTGKTQLPFVVADADSWHGLKLDKIKELVSR